MNEPRDEESAPVQRSAACDCYAATVEWLNRNGWKEWKVAEHDSHDRQWFRKYDDEPMCATNQPKSLQLRVKFWHHAQHGYDGIGLEVELHGEPIGDGGWVLLKGHAFDGVECVPEQVERLLVGWRAICAAA